MRFELTEEQLEFVSAVRGLLDDTCTPEAVRSAWGDAVAAGGGSGAGTGRVPAVWKGLAEMGVLGIMVPEANGGLGMDDEDLSPLMEEVGRHALPDPLASSAGVAVGVARSIQPTGDADAAAEATTLLDRIATGSMTVGIMFDARSDDIAGSDLVPSAAQLDALLVLTSDTVSLADRSQLDLEEVDSVDGARRLARVAVHGGTVLADGADAVAISAEAFDRAALLSASELVGLSDRMIEMAVAYATERQQFGVAIGTFQAVKHHLANAAMRLEFVRPLVMRAAHSLAHGHPDRSQHVSMAKARAALASDLAARTSLQVHGGIGYTVEYELHLFMKRAWALSRQFGDAGFHLRRVRRSLGLP